MIFVSSRLCLVGNIVWLLHAVSRMSFIEGWIERLILLFTDVNVYEKYYLLMTDLIKYVLCVSTCHVANI